LSKTYRRPKVARTDADSVQTTANEASIVKIISSPLTNLLPSTDANLAGAATARVASQEMDTLPEDAAELSQVSDLNPTDPAADVDLEKVAALRQSIADGSLQVDSQAIYDSLVADFREMLDSEPT
jgi:flagellar biosynthesis anti-sigma factor FlgM